MVLEPLALEIAEVDRDGVRAELDEQAREPGLEQRGAPARLRGTAAVGPGREIEDPLAAHRLEGSECGAEASDELLQDLVELRLAPPLSLQVVAAVEAVQRGRQEDIVIPGAFLAWRPAQRAAGLRYPGGRRG